MWRTRGSLKWITWIGRVLLRSECILTKDCYQSWYLGDTCLSISISMWCKKGNICVDLGHEFSITWENWLEQKALWISISVEISKVWQVWHWKILKAISARNQNFCKSVVKQEFKDLNMYEKVSKKSIFFNSLKFFNLRYW